jgi:hypothetical protein
MKGLVVTGVVMGSRFYYEKCLFLDNLGESSSKNQSDKSLNQSDIEQWDKYLGEYKQFMDQMKEKSNNNEKVEINPKFIH